MINTPLLVPVEEIGRKVEDLVRIVQDPTIAYYLEEMRRCLRQIRMYCEGGGKKRNG